MLFSEPEHSHSRQVFYCRYWIPMQIFTASANSQISLQCLCSITYVHFIISRRVSEQDVWKGNKNSMIGMIFKITESAWETFLA